MEAIDRNQNTILKQKLLKETRKFSFEQAVNLLCGFADAEHSRLQGDAFAYEPVLFRANPSMGFPSADLNQASELENGKVELEVNFMGLYGPSSPLPSYFTEQIIDELVAREREDLESFFVVNELQIRALVDRTLNVAEVMEKSEETRVAIRSGTLHSRVLTHEQLLSLRNGSHIKDVLGLDGIAGLRRGSLVFEVYQIPNSSQRDFLDLFNHRLITLFYLAQKRYRPEFNYQPALGNQFTDLLFSLIGITPQIRQAESAINWFKLLPHSGMLSMHRSCPEVMCKVISGYFELPLESVHIDEFVPRQVNIPKVQLCRLGVENTSLAENILLGEHAREHQSKIRVCLDDLTVTEFMSFLPLEDDELDRRFGTQYRALVTLVSFLCLAEQKFEIRIRLSEEQPVSFQLGENSITRLGWNCWLDKCLPENNWAIFD